jgi:Mg-chelatase subunit ChlD
MPSATASTSFVDSIKTDGVRARVGLVAFRDRLINEEALVLTFAGNMFTDQPDLFRREVSLLRASGGGDRPESSLDALLLAARQPFAADGEKVIVLITDAPPHIPDQEARSVEQVTASLGAAGISQCYVVMRTEDSDSQVYLKLLEGRKGMVFDLGKGEDFRRRAEHFKRSLMQLGKTISTATR